MRNLRQQVEQPQYDLSITHSYIYALVDPITEFVRYVGKANDPQLRLRRHLSKHELKPKSRKASWLKSLIAKGLEPGLILLEKVDRCQWQEAECRWIAHYRGITCYPLLTNGTSGGDGIDKGTKFSEETRKKMSASRMGRAIPPEVVAKIIAKQKGRPLAKDHCEKLSEAQKKAWEHFSEDEKEKRISNLSKPYTIERLIKVSQRHRKGGENTSGFYGVYKAHKKWSSCVRIEGKMTYLGVFVEAIEAARVRDRKVIEMAYDAPLNFPRADYD